MIDPPHSSSCLRGDPPQIGFLDQHHRDHSQQHSTPLEGHSTSDSDSNSYLYEPYLHTAQSSPMDGTNLDPLFGLVIGSGPMSIPHTTTNTLAGGPSTAMQTVLTQLPPPVPTSQIIPPVIPGGSGPSTNTVPLAIPGGVAHPQLYHRCPQLFTDIMVLQTPLPFLVLLILTLGQTSLSWNTLICLTCLA